MSKEKTWVWTGESHSGKKLSGTAKASSRRELLRGLRHEGVRVGEIRLYGASGFGRRHLPADELARFSRHFALLLGAELPVAQCLELLEGQTDHGGLRAAVREMQEAQARGQSLGDAMAAESDLFGDFYVAMIAAAERGGNLPQVLDQVADSLERNLSITRKIRSALTYPLMVSLVAIGTIAFFLLYLIPRFAEVYADFGEQLPAITTFVLDLSGKASALALPLALLVAMALIGLKISRGNPEARRLGDRLLLSLPGLGGMMLKGSTGRFARTLGSLLGSGMAAGGAVALSSRSLGFMPLREALDDVRGSLAGGATLAAALSEARVFPGFLSRMSRLGEETGRLDLMLTRVADHYEDEVDRSLERLTRVIEPLMIILLGTIVGTMLIATYLPLFKLMGIVTRVY